jgi:hypothetical protein
MKTKYSTIIFHAILVSSALMSGCGMLGGGGGLGALGDLSKLIPGGAGASLALSDNENELFMTTKEVRRATLPYEARPSNENQHTANTARLYGFIAPLER